MNFAQSISSVFKQYIIFSGRACRSEYWWYFLFSFVVGFVLSVAVSALYWIFFLATIIPSLAVLVRRLHDTGKSAWWLLIALVPLIGALVLLIFTVAKGQDGDNRYGPDSLRTPEDIGSTGLVMEDVGRGQSPPGEARHCANCGSMLVSAANFCRSCGTAV